METVLVKGKVFGDIMEKPACDPDKLEPADINFAISGIITALVTSAKSNEDLAAKALVVILEKFVLLYEEKLREKYGEDDDRKQYPNIAQAAKAKFASVLMRRVYFELPVVNEIYEGGKFLRNEPSVLQTKLEIIRRVIEFWQPQMTDESMDTFQFLIASVHSGSERESFYDQKAKGRRILDKEKKEILRIVRDHLNESWDLDKLAQWNIQPLVPWELREILQVARARRSDFYRTAREIEGYNLLLTIHNFEYWPREAKNWYTRIGEKLGAYIDQVNKLREELVKELQVLIGFSLMQVEKPDIRFSFEKTFCYLPGQFNKKDILIAVDFKYDKESIVPMREWGRRIIEDLNTTVHEWLVGKYNRTIYGTVPTYVLELHIGEERIAWREETSRRPTQVL